MELLKNGDFLVDLNDPENGWTVEGAVERVADGGVGDAGGFFVSFKGIGSIRQTIDLKNARPSWLEHRAGVRVENGKGDFGRVLLEMEFHTEGEMPWRESYLILEAPEWVNSSGGATYPRDFDFLTLTYSVTKDDKLVSLRRISLADQQLQGMERISDTSK